MRVARPRVQIGRRAPWLHEGGIRAIEFARNGNVLTTGPNDTRSWVTATGEMAWKTERGPRDGAVIGGSALCPEAGLWVAFVALAEAGSYAFRTWDLESGSFLGDVPVADSAGIHLLALDAERRRALLWDGLDASPPVLVSTDDGSVVARLEGAKDRAVFLCDGSIAASGKDESVLHFGPDGRAPAPLVPPRPPGEFDDGSAPRVLEIAPCRSAPVFAVLYADRLSVFRNDGTPLCVLMEQWGPVAFSRDGTLLTAQTSGRLGVFDLEGNEIRAFSTETVGATLCAISPDKRRIVTALGSGEMLVRPMGDEPAKAPALDATTLPGDIYSLACTRDGSALVLACAGGEVLEWKLSDSAPARLPGFGRSVASVKVLPDGSLFLYDGQHLRRLSNGGRDLLLEGQMIDAGIESSSDGACLVTIRGSEVLRIDPMDGRVLAEYLRQPSPLPQDPEIQFRPTVHSVSAGGRIAQVDPSGLTVWERDGNCLFACGLERFGNAPRPESLLGALGASTFLSESRLLVTLGKRGGHVVDLETGGVSPLSAGPMWLLAHDTENGRIAADGILSSGETGLALWDLAARSPVLEYPMDASITAAGFLPDGSLVTALSDRRVVVWEAP